MAILLNLANTSNFTCSLSRSFKHISAHCTDIVISAHCTDVVISAHCTDVVISAHCTDVVISIHRFYLGFFMMFFL